MRPALIPRSTILAGVQGAYNAVWVKGEYGEDTFYYGRGAGPLPTGVAVVSDLMRVAREIRSGSPERVSPFAHERLGEYKPVSVTLQKRAYYLRFRVDDRPGIIARLAGILAAKHISLEAVLQEPCETKHDLPFVITVEPTYEHAMREAVDADGAARLPAGAAAGAAHGDCLMKIIDCSCAGRLAAPRYGRRWPPTPISVTRPPKAAKRSRRTWASPERDATEAAGTHRCHGAEARHDRGGYRHRRRLHAALSEPRRGSLPATCWRKTSSTIF